MSEYCSGCGEKISEDDSRLCAKCMVSVQTVKRDQKEICTDGKADKRAATALNTD
jgi:hypothetical protein